MTQHQAELVPIDSLKPYKANPRRGDVAVIRESLRVNGQFRPVVVRAKTREVLAGNHTLKAAIEEGWSELWATFVDCDAKTARRIVLVDNRSNDVAGYDGSALISLLAELNGSYEGSGYDEGVVDLLIAEANAEANAGRDTDPGAVPAEPRTQPGDLWLLGEHRLLCGDATTAEAYDAVLAGAPPQVVFTDPPYGVDYRGGMKPRDSLAGDQHGTDVYDEALPLMVAHAKANAAFYVWYADLSIAAAAAAAAGLVVRGQVVWVKNNAQFMNNAHYHGKHEPCIYASRPERAPAWFGPKNEVTVWEYDRAQSNDFHPTQKPIELAQRALTNSSQPGDAVLDPFAGSGSTLIAAENLSRRCYAMEIDPGYCDVIVDRWQRHTGRTAELAPRE